MTVRKLSLVLFLIAVIATAVIGQYRSRAIAITIDDLPVMSSRDDVESRREIMRNLIAKITAAKVPVIGFVNETQLYDNGKLDEERVDLLREWLDAGLDLGNHTYSHLSLNKVSLSEYENDFLKGEIITKELLKARGKAIQYFRHPYLETGLTLKTKADFNKFLAAHGYLIAPITMDNSDWIFADAYDKASAAGDKILMDRIAKAYVPYVERKMIYWESQSRRLFGREITQIMLMHVSFINSIYFNDIVGMLRRRGYHFVSVAKALKDRAYRLPDRFTDDAGVSWLTRWATAKGDKYILSNEPLTPKFVLTAAGLKSE